MREGTNVYTVSHCTILMETLNRLRNLLDNSSAMHIKHASQPRAVWFPFMYNNCTDILKPYISDVHHRATL